MSGPFSYIFTQIRPSKSDPSPYISFTPPHALIWSSHQKHHYTYTTIVIFHLYSIFSFSRKFITATALFKIHVCHFHCLLVSSFFVYFSCVLPLFSFKQDERFPVYLFNTSIYILNELLVA